MRVLHVTSEISPWSQTGGLGEVASSLLPALAGQGVDAAALTPYYRAVRKKEPRVEDTGVTASFSIGGHPISGRFLRTPPLERRPVMSAGDAAVQRSRVLRPSTPPPRALSAPTFFFDCPELYDRDGLYGHWDDPVRFAALSMAAIEAGGKLMGGEPDVFHCHDWQAGLLPVYLERRRSPAKSVFTIHNLAYQGVFDKSVLFAVGLDWTYFTFDRLEHDDRVSFMKAGLVYSDRVTTVSPNYAAEIMTPAHGRALDGFLRAQVGSVAGILNGIDQGAWDPMKDPHIAVPFSAADPSGKSACRTALATELDLWVPSEDLFVGVVSRFTEQKGIDLVAQAVPELGALGVRLVILGNGDRWLEDRLRALQLAFPHDLRVIVAFDVALSRRIYAGVDALLLPSRFEPCGITQMYAMRYGSLPIARAVGGLRDTVSDELLTPGDGTGFLFEHADANAVRWAMSRAAAVHRDEPELWSAMVGRAMTRDFSWGASAASYAALYRALT